jgi:signal transduction histidine kinase
LSPASIRIKELAAALLGIQQRLLARLQRLEAIERKLFGSVRARRLRAGARYARQIELERQRLGRELHTGVGQMLAAIRMQTEMIEEQITTDREQVREAVSRISRLAQEGLEQVRSVSRRLHPPAWQRLSLDEALRDLWEMSGVAERFQSSLSLQALPKAPSPALKNLLYRSAQEALSNAMQHASATRIDLALTATADWVRLQIRDNGVGFDARKTMAQCGVGSGIGLRSIQDQAFALGGKLLITSGPLGTTLEISVPWGKESA